MDLEKIKILKEFRLFFGGSGGFDSWITEKAPDTLFKRLSEIENNPLSFSQLNQLLLLSHEAGATPGFFKYYWLSRPTHCYEVTDVPGFSSASIRDNKILSLQHLSWGINRFCIDALLFFGNTRTAYRTLRVLSEEELKLFFNSKRFNTEEMQNRGPALPTEQISKDDRYLISEMACKSFGVSIDDKPIESVLLEAWEAHQKSGGKRATVKELIEGKFLNSAYSNRKQELLFSSDELIDAEINSGADIQEKLSQIGKRFNTAREKAIKNTTLYLSMADQLDVYVASSMRNRKDFRDIADLCEKIFKSADLRPLNIRYFDPTLSAADGHMNKGLVECLMVKCAKALVYCAGEKDSYGKDAEAAMALSLGKPVIFFCNEEVKERFYKDVHPLSRLIDFESGVPVGAMVTSDPEIVSKLLFKTFENKMRYKLEQPKDGFLQLKEELTESVVRFQTNDNLLRETFWNYYHNK